MCITVVETHTVYCLYGWHCWSNIELFIILDEHNAFNARLFKFLYAINDQFLSFLTWSTNAV